MNTFQSNGFDGCFHDGCERLPVIDSFHKEIRHSCHHSDQITPHIIDLAQNYMLRDRSNRLNAQQLSSKFETLLRSCERMLDSSDLEPTEYEVEVPQLMDTLITSTSGVDRADLYTRITSDETNMSRPRLCIVPCQSALNGLEPHVRETNSQSTDSGYGSSQISVPSGVPHLENQTTSELPPTTGYYSPLGGRERALTIARLAEHRDAIKTGRDPNPLAQEVVEFILHNLAKRDQFFFIDDSTSMKHHAPVVEQTFLSLSWLAKQLDPDKLELCFSSTPHAVVKAKRTKKLFKCVAAHKYRGDQTLMAKNFGSLVDDILTPRLPWKFRGINFKPWARNRQMSVYIFTDGNWGDNSQGACGVEGPLQRLIKAMKKRDLDRNQISLHFIRFGSLQNGKKYLDFLDEYGKNEVW